MDAHTKGRVSWAFVVVAGVLGVGLIVGGSRVLTGVGVILLVLGIITTMPAIVLSWGVEG